MESTNNSVKRSESVRKRPLEQSISSNGDTLPTKVKPGDKSDSNISMDSAVQFEMDQKVHDVEEHFRRSLQSFQQKQASSSFLPVITNTSLKTSSLDHESHQIVIAENSTHEQSVHDSSSSSQNINFPNVLTKVPSNPATLAGPTSNQSPQVFLSLKTNYVGSDKARDKLANEKIGGTQVLSTPNQKNNTIFPNVQGMVPATSNWIPVIDNAQLFTAPPTMAATPGTLQPQTSPVFFIGPSNIPMLTPSGVVFINPATDVQQRSHVVSSGNTPLPVPSNTSNIPNYIILPPTFSTNPVNFGLTLEQLNSSNFQRQQHNSHQKINIDLTSPDDNSSVDSNCSMEMHEELSRSVNVPGVDSVEEHFARALGDQWNEVKAGNNSHSNHNKISA